MRTSHWFTTSPARVPRAAVLAPLLLAAVLAASVPRAPAATIGNLAYRPASGRLFDTRPDQAAAPGPKGFVGAGQSIDVQVTGQFGIPLNAVAVALNVTATQSAAPGFVTVWPTGVARPLASNLNVVRAGQTVPNFVVVGIGASGRVSLFSSGGAHLLGDIAGYYVATSLSAPCPGQFFALGPGRALDTRAEQTSAPGPKGFVGAGGSVRVDLRSAGVVLPADTTAAVVTVTGTDAAAAGFVTAWPTGAPRPETSVLNLDGPGHVAANLAIVAVASDGSITLFASGGAHLIVDLVGVIRNNQGTRSCADGWLFVPDAPFRIVDTRPGEPAAAPDGRQKGALAPGETVAYHNTPNGFIPEGSIYNVTMIDAAPGHVTMYWRPFARPNTSVLNISSAGETRAGAAFVQDRDSGALFTSGGGHAAIDVMAWIS